ncbi:MAG TPA: Tm-1-like ATP-binding domain-containing protein [Planctomycetota bacterium]|jgi:uncharacterized protein (UPF0261 family)|nr:Tm-1-like ATP-binding domain-containing protein [Planctomycetota bacterium]
MAPTIAVLATLDTKGTEAAFVKQHIEALGGEAILIDMGLVGEPGTSPDVDRSAVITAGGSSLEALLESPDRQEAAPILIAGTTTILREMLAEGRIDAVLGFGGTQGSSNCSAVMQALPYGFPKILLSTMASGDTSSFVGIKDITMMFPVSDILGLNPLARTILANAAACAWGMAHAAVPLERAEDGRAVIAMTNLGVLTDGTMHALKRFEEAGYEVIVFHAVGSGGLAMEQLMKEGHVQAVFDYGLGEIADEVHGGLRAANPERLTVAGQLGLPQVIVPGGTEHIGLFTEPNVVPERFKNHQHTFHNPIIFAPRLNAEEMREVAASICERLQQTRGKAVMYLPLRSTSRYGAEDGPLRDPESDAAFYAALREGLPDAVEVVDVDADAEDTAFVDQAVDRLLAML